MAENSTSGKLGLIMFIASIPIAIGLFLLNRNKKQEAQNMANLNLKGAIDVEDEQTVLKMVALFKNSIFARDLGYIASILPKYMMGGKNQPPTSNDYYTLTVNGQKVIPKSVALMQAVWSGWLGTYTLDAKSVPVIPVSGVTQEKANAAADLAIKIAGLWEQYKNAREPKPFSFV